jgi:hypothetical protein
LKNDGVRQWEGWHPIYEMENKINVWNHQPDSHLKILDSSAPPILPSAQFVDNTTKNNGNHQPNEIGLFSHRSHDCLPKTRGK